MWLSSTELGRDFTTKLCDTTMGTGYLLYSVTLFLQLVTAAPTSGKDLWSGAVVQKWPCRMPLGFCESRVVRNVVTGNRRRAKSICHFSSAHSSCLSYRFFRNPLTTTSPSTDDITYNKRLELYRPQDSLVAGISEISMGCNLGVLWSEYAIATTGCGPYGLSDGLERFCYQGVIVAMGMVVFNRIVRRTDLADTCLDYFGALMDSTVWQVRAAEWLTLFSVLGALVALAIQLGSGASMNGLSEIDVGMCRAMQQLK
jgi:hypothetical protein